MHFDNSISLGNLITAVTFLFMAGFAWSNMRTRVESLEVWRIETNKLLKSMTETLTKVSTIVEERTKRRF